MIYFLNVNFKKPRKQKNTFIKIENKLFSTNTFLILHYLILIFYKYLRKEKILLFTE